MSHPSQHLVIVGAGISGLAAAWAAKKKAEECNRALRITVLEASGDVGGKALSTTHPGGWTTEAGPTGFLDNEPVLDRLVEIAQIEKVPAAQAAARRFVVQGGRLREIHPHPLKFARSGILSPLGLARVLRERWIPKRTQDSDESVWDFAARRLGQQAADRLIQPMVLGVFAGDAKTLSLPAAFPRMAEMEQEYGSLFRAMGALRKARRRGQAPKGRGTGEAARMGLREPHGGQGAAGGGPAGPGGVLTSFHGGLQSLPRSLAENASFEVRMGATVSSIGRNESGAWVLGIKDCAETVRADALVLATEGYVAAKLLQGCLPSVAGHLEPVPHPGVQVVSLGLAPEDASRMPTAFGCLIPRTEGPRALGFLWDSHIFPGRAPEGHVLVRALFGGAVDEAANEWSADRLIQQTQQDLETLFGIQGQPVLATHTPWAKAIPQYTLGHNQRLRQIEAAIEAGTRGGAPLWLAGNSLYGVAFTKAAARGWQCGEEAAASVMPAGPAG